MKKLTLLALISIAYFVIVIVILHFLQPDLNPLSHPTSEYAVGPYGFLMATAFFSMSVASFSLVIGLYYNMSQAARPRIGLVLLAIWGVGVLIAMTFPINPEGTELTITSTIHRINGPLTFLSLTAGTILVSRSFRRDENWQPFYRSALTISLIMFMTFIITGVNIATKSGFEGLCQRVFLVLFATWFILTTMHLRSAITKNKTTNQKKF